MTDNHTLAINAFVDELIEKVASECASTQEKEVLAQFAEGSKTEAAERLRTLAHALEKTAAEPEETVPGKTKTAEENREKVTIDDVQEIYESIASR